MKSEIELNFLAQSLRKKLGLDPITSFDIFSVVKQIKELTLVIYPMGKNISGLCYKDDKLIAINSEHSYGRCRFTLAHELYHFYFDESNVKNICIKQNLLDEPENEKEANLFASYLLAPYESFKMFVKDISIKDINENQIIEIEQYFGMSRLAVLFRLKKEGLIDCNLWNKFSTNVIPIALSLGYDDKLYKPYSNDPITYGRYITIVNELYKKNIINSSKKNELLVKAFRSDMIYGDYDDEDFEID